MEVNDILFVLITTLEQLYFLLSLTGTIESKQISVYSIG